MVKRVCDLPSPRQLRHWAIFWVSHFFRLRHGEVAASLRFIQGVHRYVPVPFSRVRLLRWPFKALLHISSFFFLLPIQHIALLLMLSYINFDPRFSFIAKYYFLFPFPSHFFELKLSWSCFSPSLFFPHFPPPWNPALFHSIFATDHRSLVIFRGGGSVLPPCLNCIICHRQS